MSDFASRIKKPNANSPYKRPSVLTVIIALLMLSCLVNYLGMQALPYKQEVDIDSFTNTIMGY